MSWPHQGVEGLREHSGIIIIAQWKFGTVASVGYGGAPLFRPYSTDTISTLP